MRILVLKRHAIFPSGGGGGGVVVVVYPRAPNAVIWNISLLKMIAFLKFVARCRLRANPNKLCVCVRVLVCIFIFLYARIYRPRDLLSLWQHAIFSTKVSLHLRHGEYPTSDNRLSFPEWKKHPFVGSYLYLKFANITVLNHHHH